MTIFFSLQSERDVEAITIPCDELRGDDLREELRMAIVLLHEFEHLVQADARHEYLSEPVVNEPERYFEGGRAQQRTRKVVSEDASGKRLDDGHLFGQRQARSHEERSSVRQLAADALFDPLHISIPCFDRLWLQLHAASHGGGNEDQQDE